jgi:hypothetical protein
MAERQGIEIDYCPKCRGVWLDRGELDKIIERSAERERDDFDDDRDRKHYERDDWHRYGKRRKRKSFFSELFDFD